MSRTRKPWRYESDHGRELQTAWGDTFVISGGWQEEPNDVHELFIGHALSEDDAKIMVAAGNHLEDVVGLLGLALRYMEHPDVQAIPFALSAATVADRIRTALNDMKASLK